MKKIILIIIFTASFVSLSFSQLSESQVNEFFNRFTDNTERLDQLFSPKFLTVVPVTQLVQIRNEFERKYGKYIKVKIESGNNCKVFYENAVFPCIIAFDHSGLVSTLWFGAPSFENDKIEQIKQDLNNISGTVSICLRRDGREVFSQKKDLPLAIGSTFKLYILKALVYKIQKGELKWDDTLHISKNCKSLPSGILNKWPEGCTITVQTAANLMISISDNTAADLLIHKLGREFIEKFVPSTMVPFYTTKELFELKLGVDEDYVKWFTNADTDTKRKELAKLDTMDVTSLNVYNFNTPTHIEVEWFATTEDLCKTIESLQGIKALSINPGIIDKKNWYYFAFKGGSEPGVLNYTYLLQKADTSPLFSLSATINNPRENVDVNKEFTFLIKRIIDLIKSVEQWD